MNITNSISVSDIFPEYLFWEHKIELLDFANHIDLIIPRALYFTTKETFESNISRLEKIYPPKDILKCIQNTKEMISNEVCELVAKRYNVPVKFRFTYS